jgi:hypothetical protein
VAFIGAEVSLLIRPMQRDTENKLLRDARGVLPHEVCYSPDQAAHYHILGPKLIDSPLTRHLAGREERNLYFILQGAFRLISQRNKTSHHTHYIGRALPQAVSQRLLVTWARSHPHVVPCVIYGGQADTGTGSLGPFDFPVSITPS